MVKSTSESKKKSKGKELINPAPIKRNQRKTVQSTQTKRKITQQAQTKLRTIQNKIIQFATHKGIPQETTLQIMAKIAREVVNASDQTRKAMKFLESIKTNNASANTIIELIGESLLPASPAPVAGPSSPSQKDSVEDVDEYLPMPSSRSSEKVKLTAEMAEDIKKQLEARKSRQVTTPESSQFDSNYFMEIETEGEDRDITTLDKYMKNLDVNEENEENEPPQVTHMKNILKLLKKHPEVKSDINKTLLEMFTKAKIKPEQYEILKQHIDTKEQPQTIRIKKAPKPRAKKSAQTDKALIPMDIETSSKLPKGKAIKNNQKKKPKIVTL